MSPVAVVAASPATALWRRCRRAARLLRRPTIALGMALVLLIGALGVAAPWLTPLSPTAIQASLRNRLPGATLSVRNDSGERTAVRAWMGTDSLGRDLFSRVLHGTRISLLIGLSVVLISLSCGLLLGLLAGYFRWLDGVLMRAMDGLMAIPAILLAITLVAMAGASVLTVVLAIALPEIPRVVRLVRATVLTVREEPFVEAAIASGTSTTRVLRRHILPATLAPLIVQATYIAGSAILLEAILGFLGVGLPTDIPSWGNVLAAGRSVFQSFPHNILFPGLFLSLTVLAINLLGDGLRDALDPRLRHTVR